MTIGTVVKSMDLSKSIRELEDQKLFLVRTNGVETVALDQTNAREGDRVLLLISPGAGSFCMDAPVDALILGVFAENS